ncbi:MAG: protein-glutamate O-methyltransferase CheR [candidate division KSB1 bacterium]|nr:protein-glutamate O-methyltransferase CheR [candidate division KSB1 bacterium]MDQ7065944.1 protein-glutamate O-methyltransferase CheR [candidate division KSB1 bacterium]
MTSTLQLSSSELDKIRQLIYRESGMLFPNKKDYFLKNRLEQRAKHTQSKTFQDYYHRLLTDSTELQNFLEELTVNETYFFRDFPQLKGFAEILLPKYLEQKRAKQEYHLRVWSAACSTGEEPYTLAIILKEMIEDFDRWNIKIHATDIDRRVLKRARIGLYSDRSMKDTPIAYRKKYFKKTPDGWQILPTVANLVQFEQLNLIDRMAMRRRRNYDFIFCRNVLIYFDNTSRKRVVIALYDALIPGGYLFLGHAESVGRITAAFSLERYGDFLCYKRPEV